MKTVLVKIDITRDVNEHGERAYLVTPYYLTPDRRLVSVPDSRGWPTLAEAKAEAERIGGGKIE